MRNPRLVILAVSAVIVLCAALVHSMASGEGSATSPLTAASPASKPSPADHTAALKVAAMLNKCGACHPHSWEPSVAGKPRILWGQDLSRLVAEGKYVVPGNPQESKLYKFYEKGGHQQVPITPEDTKLLGQWILRGCIDPRPAPAPLPVARKAVKVLDSCCRCHRHGWEEPGKPKVTWGKNIARLIEEKKQFLPGQPGQSSGYTILRDNKHPKYATPEQTYDDAKTLELWISQGCIDPTAKPATSKPTSRPAASANSVTGNQ